MHRDHLADRRKRQRQDPCPTCHGSGALLRTPGVAGRVLPAQVVVPNPRLWHANGVAPCPVCLAAPGREPRRPPAQAARAVWS